MYSIYIYLSGFWRHNDPTNIVDFTINKDCIVNSINHEVYILYGFWPPKMYNIYIYCKTVAPTCGGPISRVGGTREVRGNHRKSPPTSSRGVPKTPLTLARRGTGRRPSGGAVAADAARSGRRSGRRRRHRCLRTPPGLTGSY